MVLEQERIFVVGEKVARARKEKGLTQREVAAIAKKTGEEIPYEWIAGVEAKKAITKTSASRVRVLSRILGAPVEDFMPSADERNVSAVDYQSTPVPVYGSVSAEDFSCSFDGTPESHLTAAFPVPVGKKIGAWRVSGDCMHGTAEDGEYVVAIQAHDVRNGGLAIVRHNGEFTFKRVFKFDDRVELRPDNKKFKTITIRAGKPEIIAEVVWVLKRP